METGFEKTGYLTNPGAKGSVTMGMTGAFGRAAGFSSSGTTAHIFQNAAKKDKPLHLTDIMPNAKFQVPKIKPVSTLNTDGKAVANVNTKSLTQQVDRVGSSYMDANKRAMSEIREAMGQAIDPKNPGMGHAVFDSLTPHGQSGAMAAAASMIDPTGVAGGAATILSQIVNEMKRPNSAYAQKVIEQTRVILAMKSSAEKAAHESGARPHPPEFDWTKVETPKQLLDFIKRDPMNDPVMQEVQEARFAINTIEKSQEHYARHKNDKATDAKIEQAVATGNTNDLKAMMGDETKAAFVAQGATLAQASSLSPLASLIDQVGTTSFDIAGTLKFGGSTNFISPDSKPPAPTRNFEPSPAFTLGMNA